MTALVARGKTVALDADELKRNGVSPVRPGEVVRVERGAYGFEAVILCVDGRSSREDVFRCQVTDVWGSPPCA